MLKIRRVLISVWDKRGIIELARTLASLKIEIISTGKTAILLRNNGINVSDVVSVTSSPEILSGRVKTLHPKIFGGILANKKNPLHTEEIKNLGIQPFDMVIINFYPFLEKTKEAVSWDDMIEYIDVGGPAMIRAGAKNYKNVACVSSINQYSQINKELIQNKGFLSEEILKDLACQAFYLTKEYDSSIYYFLTGKDVITLNLQESFPLRYGENPHQQAGLYKIADKEGIGFRQLQGKELSYNNFLDLDTAFLCVKEFNESAAAIVKHGSLCGVGVDRKLANAYKKAYSTDTLSSFGGIIGLNRKVDKDTAIQIIKSEFKECVIAPLFSKESLKIFATKPNMRIIEADFHLPLTTKEVRTTSFGYLVQTPDTGTLDLSNLKCVTKKQPSQRQLKDLAIAWKVVKFVKSNAIVVAKNNTILGIGGGQPSRVDSVKIALEKAQNLAKGAVLASDGFFPKDDSIKLAGKRKISAIIQPGGSIKDEEVIKACNKLGIVMVFTGTRHFRH